MVFGKEERYARHWLRIFVTQPPLTGAHAYATLFLSWYYHEGERMQSLTEQFVKEAERRILTGEWEIGMKIPPLRVLAEEFHVSRSVINAGIVELCNNGYLKTAPRQYIRVADWRQEGNFALLSGMIEHGLYDMRFVSELLEGRMAIEKAVARRAATARTEEDLRLIGSIIERERGSETAEARALTDRDFHHAIAVAAHNFVYTVVLNSFDRVADRLTRIFYETDVDRALVLQMHADLLSALERGECDRAEEAMETLLAHGENALKINKQNK